jgi:hypothetical protein
MNRRLITQVRVIFITSWSLQVAPLSAYAHDDEAYIELNVTQAQPGMSIEVCGRGFHQPDRFSHPDHVSAVYRNSASDFADAAVFVGFSTGHARRGLYGHFTSFTQDAVRRSKVKQKTTKGGDANRA